MSFLKSQVLSCWRKVESICNVVISSGRVFQTCNLSIVSFTSCILSLICISLCITALRTAGLTNSAGTTVRRDEPLHVDTRGDVTILSNCNTSRPYPLCLFSEVSSRLSSSGVPSHDFYHNFYTVCAVTVVIFRHFNRSLLPTLLLR